MLDQFKKEKSMKYRVAELIVEGSLQIITAHTQGKILPFRLKTKF